MVTAVQHDQQEPPTFGMLLRRHRTAAGYSQDALAERAGISTRAISDLERGVKTRPHPATMRFLADALDLDADDRAELALASRPEHATATQPRRETTTSTLPTPATSIVGRTTELATAIDWIESGTTRLLTLTGPGGVGKTRLALETARSVIARFRDGATLVELAPLGDPSLVIPTVAAALGLRDTGGRSMADAIQHNLHGRHMLLVLDNCEHVLDAVRPLVAGIIATAPSVTILATSRPPLRLKGEQAMPLAPLALPDQGEHRDIVAASPAIELFVQRARMVRPDFALTDDNAAAVAGICARLDGLPLAIELAASRIRMLSPEALIALLSQRLRLLTSGPEDAPERQRTLRAAITWSHDLLTAEQQDCFRRLAVFSGGCTLESAAEVTTSSDLFAALDHLEALGDQGLVLSLSSAPDGELRFRMLGTVRDYALEQLVASGDADTTHAALATSLLTLAEHASENLQGPEPQRWLDRLEREQDNFRAALGWSLGDTGDAEVALRLAATLWPFWHMRGHLQEGHAWLERAITQGNRVSPISRATAYLTMANIANNLEDHPHARALYEESRQLCETLDNQHGVAAALVGLGMVATSEGDYDQATAFLTESLALHRQVGTPDGILPCIYAMGRLAVAMGDLDEAERRFTEAREMCPPDVTSLMAYLTLELAQLQRYRGNTPAAQDLAQHCLSQFRTIGERRAEASCLAELGHLALLQGDEVQASAKFRNAAGMHSQLRDELGIVLCLEGLAILASTRGQIDVATPLFGAAVAWRDRTNTRRTAPEQARIDQATATIQPPVTPAPPESDNPPITLDQALELAARIVVTA